MKHSLLFWAFQNLSLISDVAKKLKRTSNVSEFYVQINDSEKTISLLDINPEEIIRTKYDLNNLYQWLSRFQKKNLFVLVDLFTLVHSNNFEEDSISLKKILQLGFKIIFISPKILHPQSIRFCKNSMLNSVYLETINYSRNLKNFYEILINSGCHCYILPTSIPESIVINSTVFELFKPKKKFKLQLIPKILKKFNASYSSSESYAINIAEKISGLFVPSEADNKLIQTEIEADFSTQFASSANISLTHFSPKFPISLEHFFHIKLNSEEHNYILWLIYQSLCEYEIKNTKNTELNQLSDFYFSNSR